MAKICHVTRPQGKRKSNVRTESHLCPVIRLFALARAGKPAGGTIARKWRIIWEKRRSVCSTPMNRRRKSRSTEGGDKWHCHLNYQPRQKNHLGPKHRWMCAWKLDTNEGWMKSRVSSVQNIVNFPELIFFVGLRFWEMGFLLVAVFPELAFFDKSCIKFSCSIVY